MHKTLLLQAVSALIAALFVYAAVSKILHLEQTKVHLGQSPFISEYAIPLAYGVPAMEIAIATLLVFPAWQFLGLLTALFMLNLFNAYILAMLSFSHYVPCSCGGVIEQLSWKGHIALNTVFACMAFVALLIQQKQKHSLSKSL